MDWEGARLAQGLDGLAHKGRMPALVAAMSSVDLRPAEVMASGATGPTGEEISCALPRGAALSRMDLGSATTPFRLCPNTWGLRCRRQPDSNR